MLNVLFWLSKFWSNVLQGEPRDACCKRHAVLHKQRGFLGRLRFEKST